MQFFTAAFLFAAAVSGAAITPRQFDYDVPAYDVTEFNAYCLPHGGACYYDFQFVRHASQQVEPIRCSTSVRGDGVLPAVNGTCRETPTTWSISNNQNNGDLLFSISQQSSPSSDDVGYHVISECEIETDEDCQQRYVGPQAFPLNFTIN